jgi:hypothetical protein
MQMRIGEPHARKGEQHDDRDAFDQGFTQAHGRRVSQISSWNGPLPLPRLQGKGFVNRNGLVNRWRSG